MTDSTDPAQPPWRIDTSTPHAVRRYNYWLGGKDNFAVDRESGDEIEEAFPQIRVAAQANRDFLQRTVQYLVGQERIGQFLDIGTGLPTADNTHEVAQRLEPAARIVYVDNDPLVMIHARALLTSTPQGRTAYIEADLRNPDAILRDPGLTDTLELSQPVALMLVAILHFIDDDEQAYACVRTLIDALPPGSFLVATHATEDFLEETSRTNLRKLKTDFVTRNRDQFARFFDGLELVHPGIAVVSQWRPDPGTTPPPPEHVSVYGAVARIPARISGAR